MKFSVTKPAPDNSPGACGPKKTENKIIIHQDIHIKPHVFSQENDMNCYTPDDPFQTDSDSSYVPEEDEYEVKYSSIFTYVKCFTIISNFTLI